jgi:hypothetical protein
MDKFIFKKSPKISQILNLKFDEKLSFNSVSSAFFGSFQIVAVFNKYTEICLLIIEYKFGGLPEILHFRRNSGILF